MRGQPILILMSLLLLFMVGQGCGTSPALKNAGAGVELPLLPQAALVPADTVYVYDLDEVPNLTILMEVLGRGFTKWGCRDFRLRQARWRPPTEGSPVERYVIEYTTLLSWVPDTTLTIPWPTYAEAGAGSTWARVAGVDSLDRQGPWSEPSAIELLEVE